MEKVEQYINSKYCEFSDEVYLRKMTIPYHKNEEVNFDALHEWIDRQLDKKVILKADKDMIDFFDKIEMDESDRQIVEQVKLNNLKCTQQVNKTLEWLMQIYKKVKRSNKKLEM